MKKIVVFYSGYLPGKKYGGPVTSLYNLIELLHNEFEFYVVVTDHDLNSKERYTNIKEGWNLIGNAKVMYLSDKEFNYNSFEDIFKNIRPDCIYTSSIFSVVPNQSVYKLSKKFDIPLILAPRGELNPSALKHSWYKKKPYLWYLRFAKIFKNFLFQTTSNEEYLNTISVLNVKKEQVQLLSNVPCITSGKNMIDKKQGELKVLYVARILENKNLLFALKALENVSSNICMDIYGSKEDIAYWELCNNKIEQLPVNIEVNYKGNISPLEIRNIYSLYDCLLFPTKFENYGQVIAEAISSDCVPLISLGTTPWDDINDYCQNSAISLDNIDEFSKQIDYLASLTLTEYMKLIGELRRYKDFKLNIRKIKEDYLKMFNSVIKKERF